MARSLRQIWPAVGAADDYVCTVPLELLQRSVGPLDQLVAAEPCKCRDEVAACGSSTRRNPLPAS